VSIPSNTNEVPKVSASADNEAVKVNIVQAESTSGKAIVKFDYNGIVKTYNVVFAAE
jgi:arabinoxylan arabinofuranohydrolase